MLKILSAAEMQEVDRKSIEEFGIPGLILMENAGRASVEIIRQRVSDIGEKKITVLCGKGNNGGDGFVIARHLFLDGIPVQICLTGKRSQLKGDAKTNADIALNLGIPIQELEEQHLNRSQHNLRHSHIIIDAIFGTGLTRPVEGIYKSLFEIVNEMAAQVISIDIPSGLDSDSGNLIGPHIRADATIALGQYKRSHCLAPAQEAMGERYRVDIGLAPQALEECTSSIFEVETGDVQKSLIPRTRESHKGSFGHTLIIAGSPGKAGAGGLAALAAMRIGSGLVTLAIPESCKYAFESSPLEVMTLALPANSEGFIDSCAHETILQQSFSAVALGPGLSTHPDTLNFLSGLIPQLKCPIVIDADGINAFAKNKELTKLLNSEMVLTPHPKEFSRITGKEVKDILASKLEALSEFIDKYPANILLKGPGTLMAFQDGTQYINSTGNPALATAGSGDVLTGIIAGLLAQGLSLKEATYCGVFIHGFCADLYIETFNERTLVAGDLIDLLPEALKKLLG